MVGPWAACPPAPLCLSPACSPQAPSPTVGGQRTGKLHALLAGRSPAAGCAPKPPPAPQDSRSRQGQAGLLGPKMQQKSHFSLLNSYFISQPPHNSFPTVGTSVGSPLGKVTAPGPSELPGKRAENSFSPPRKEMGCSPLLLFKGFLRPGGTDGVGGEGNRTQVSYIAPLMPMDADDPPKFW